MSIGNGALMWQYQYHLMQWGYYRMFDSLKRLAAASSASLGSGGSSNLMRISIAAASVSFIAFAHATTASARSVTAVVMKPDNVCPDSKAASLI